MSKIKSEEVASSICTGYTHWEYERTIAWSFNRLKGKIYNLIEASIDNEQQKIALKGLIKGFSNDEYKKCVEETRFVSIQLGLSKREDYDMPHSAEPLENKDGIFA
jgi:hypothetical protein